MRCVIYLRVSTREQAEKGEGKEGFSIPAQREACARHVRDAGWLLADEYVDRGESARSADRPALKAMLARIAEDRDVDAVVVRKIDRLARNMEDHVAIRALFRRRGVEQLAGAVVGLAVGVPTASGERGGQLQDLLLLTEVGVQFGQSVLGGIDGRADPGLLDLQGGTSMAPP